MIRNVDGHDADEIKTAIDTARKSDQPTLICCKTVIGFGSPNKQGKEECHGAPLGADEIAATRAALGWEHAPFEIPAQIYAEWDAKELAPPRKPSGTSVSPPTRLPIRNWPPNCCAA